MKDVIKRLPQLLFGDYSIYRIYSREMGGGAVNVPTGHGLHFARVEKAAVETSEETLIREQAWYFGTDSQVFAYLEGARIISLCVFWYADRYRTRNFWPLAEREAKLVQIVTLPEKRGSGIATALIASAAAAMFTTGFVRLYARIWHSNAPSLRAFQRAGWTQVATVIEIYPLRRKRPFRLTLRAKR
jgi:RimJ/RimL family protein N-acetyltransferase